MIGREPPKNLWEQFFVRFDIIEIFYELEKIVVVKIFQRNVLMSISDWIKADIQPHSVAWKRLFIVYSLCQFCQNEFKLQMQLFKF